MSCSLGDLRSFFGESVQFSCSSLETEQRTYSAPNDGRTPKPACGGIVLFITTWEFVIQVPSNLEFSFDSYFDP